MIDDNKSFWLLLSINSLIADETLELDDLLDLIIGEATLGLDKLLALLCGGVEESRVDLTVGFN